MPYTPKPGKDRDLGMGVYYRLAVNMEGKPVGAIVTHNIPGETTHNLDTESHPEGSDSAGPDWCAGYIRWVADRNKPVWTLVSLEPLEVSPSLLCHCGHHGFILRGRWQPA
jgi:hypothetical protein